MIKDLRAFKVFNSAGKETLALSVLTDKYHTVSIPSGTSKGDFEAIELPLDVVMKKLEKIKRDIVGMDENNHEDIDYFLQKIGGGNFKKIGGNLVLAISLSIAKAAMRGELWKLNPYASQFPYPLGNVIGGGSHGGQTDFQEFLIVPIKSKTISDAIETNRVLRGLVGEELGARNLLVGKNLENAWAAKLDDTKTLDLLSDIVGQYGCRIGIDMAASQLFVNGRYNYANLQKSLNPAQQLDFAIDLIKTYKLFYVEDPFQQRDFGNFAELTRAVGDNCIIAGDDLYCTNYSRLEKGIEMKSSNGIIIKPNQAGLLTLAQKTANLAKRANLVLAASHRSLDTADNWLADLSIAFGCELIKTGIVGKEREAKLNRLNEIWKKTEKPRMARLNF